MLNNGGHDLRLLRRKEKNSVGPCDTSRVPQAAPLILSLSHVATNNERAYYEYTNELIDSFVCTLESVCVNSKMMQQAINEC